MLLETSPDAASSSPVSVMLVFKVSFLFFLRRVVYILVFFYEFTVTAITQCLLYLISTVQLSLT